MADHTADADRSAGAAADSPGDTTPLPDYELDERLDLTQRAQYRALFEETREQIVSLLLERAATTSDLAVALNKPKGTVGHHLKVLEEAGLVRVVRTKRVRAIEAKYYGRTARVFIFQRSDEATTMPQRALSTAAEEISNAPPDLPFNANIRHARIPTERAAEWSDRVNDLIMEFTREPRGGDVVYGFAIGIYPTTRRPLPDAGHDGPPEAP
ncbi:ArsR/SmtB family transcription factor [Phytoactinopolyspora limicola]|uniref:ArsR/SmtB family transcription factor n=1 Tax=Phytoactinopolyspora limicola TaxID=2715536 RepID=UPI00140D6F9C|nr:winged helix-turn-helix domain-containing protein [Phytoactinopolyspora limicola]